MAALDSDAFKHYSRLLDEQSAELDCGVIIPIEGTELFSRILKNPSDPDATFRTKGDKKHIGNSLNLVEVHDPKKETGLIMRAELKGNTYSDAQTRGLCQKTSLIK